MDCQVSEAEFKAHLQNELGRRCRSNSRYSLRAFARVLELDPSSVSQIIAGKRRTSARMMTKICEKIGWPQSNDAVAGEFELLSADAFAAISDWYHYVILDLTLLKNFKNDAQWIARKLGITRSEAQIALERLQRLGMLVKKNGRLVKGQGFYANYVEGQTSSAHKEYQRQILRKALDAIDSCAQEKKDITCITIAADSRKLPEAKTRIKKFRRELCAFLEEGESDSVHLLAVQLFPVTGDET
ncbi:MAG: TIGR02147 family protein [Bdellovibrionota bacterium]